VAFQLSWLSCRKSKRLAAKKKKSFLFKKKLFLTRSLRSLGMVRLYLAVAVVACALALVAADGDGVMVLEGVFLGFQDSYRDEWIASSRDASRESQSYHHYELRRFYSFMRTAQSACFP